MDDYYNILIDKEKIMQLLRHEEHKLKYLEYYMFLQVVRNYKPESVTDKHKEYQAISNKAWRQRNKDKIKANQKRYRLKLKENNNE